jgi:GTP pyrophosphokinase
MPDAPMLTERFLRAFAMASEVHARQLRKGTQIPYVAHVMSVAALVLEHGGGEDAAISGLLHDAVEDADDGAAVERRIRGEFGDHVADTVLGCSDAVGVSGHDKPPWRERKEAYLRHLEATDDPDTLLVSVCDKLHNARSIVADLREVGPEVWTRFSMPDPEAQLWYYQSLADTYARRAPARVSDEVARLVDEMRALADG